MHLLNYFFAWPAGAVWGNIIASVIWGLPGGLLAFKKLKKHQRKLHDEQIAHMRYLAKKLGDD